MYLKNLSDITEVSDDLATCSALLERIGESDKLEDLPTVWNDSDVIKQRCNNLIEVFEEAFDEDMDCEHEILHLINMLENIVFVIERAEGKGKPPKWD